MRTYLISLVLLFATMLCSAQKLTITPANPAMSPEAKALLELHYRISGKYILTGQHNYPVTRDRNSRFAAKFLDKTPVIWSSDFGFSKEGDKDSYLARPEIVKEAIRQHKKGSLITLCWHAVPPTANEPITFQPQGMFEPGKLASVQGRLLEEQYKDLLTPGTEIYKNWARQVDTIAVYLKQLQEAKVPVLWRPYHEMNGDWFWWGERVGKYSTADIYRQLFDRLVNIHHLNNLVWVWNVDRPGKPIRQFRNFYPGNDYLDILSLDVYGSDFNQAYYDSLLVLAKGKPLLFGEVGQPPLTPILDKQPLWTSWVIWAGMTRGMTDEHIAMLKDPRVLGQEDPAWWKVAEPYRKACGLPLLPLKDKYISAGFAGTWILDEGQTDKHIPAPFLIKIDRDFGILYVKKYEEAEYGEDIITNEELWLDGTEMKSSTGNSTSLTKVIWNNSTGNLEKITSSTRKWGERSMELKSSEKWILKEGGKNLIIIQSMPDRQGNESTSTAVYSRITGGK
ncbi:MAG: glycosyl hydrolase [Bacteroidales bacterium]